MGSHEIAALLHVSRQRVQQLSKRPDFPAPLAALAMGQVWDGEQIRAWVRAGRRPADPSR